MDLRELFETFGNLKEKFGGFEEKFQSFKDKLAEYKEELEALKVKVKDYWQLESRVEELERENVDLKARVRTLEKFHEPPSPPLPKHVEKHKKEL